MDYCLIGGLAVDAYVEPVVSLDVDVVLALNDIETIVQSIQAQRLKVERFEHSVNVGSPNSDIRIQIHIDERYQEFITRAEVKEVLGYQMKVVCVEDVLQGKIWAYEDQTRRQSKRQKDLADIMRLKEVFLVLERLTPINFTNVSL
ncbi:MAG: hypothetical protein FJY65_03395 [Calditrichaeota bacterium]|nr:hypothetical protein [Calditrichota bacterium]